ncbi:radical SAM protein [Candidatus Woesearchaeota archaeon]|nr:radical SAM protein [Candidatus Woesearchaeota archaeon]
MKEKTASVPEQIDIMVNSECNARCQMCIQEITWKMPTGKQDPFTKGVSDYISEYHDLGGRKVIITGGEPTLRPSRVISTLEELSKYPDWELIAMYTNGSRLLKESDGETLAQRLKKFGLCYVNLSSHHYDSTKNNRIFGIDVGNPQVVGKHLSDVGMPLRFCATLQKGGLETTDDVLKYLDFAQQCGAQDAYLRELFRVYNVNSNNEAISSHLEYINFNFVSLKPIIDGLRDIGLIQKGQRANFQGREKNELAFETKDGFPFYTSQLEIGRERAEELPYLVIMPNGNLYSTWMGDQFKVNSLKEFIEVGKK